jgi:hypothetical protein
MTDTAMIILTYVFSGLSLAASGYTIAVSYRTAKRLKRLRRGRP